MTDTELLQAIEDQRLMVNVSPDGVTVWDANGRHNKASDIRGALWPFAAQPNTEEQP